MSIYRLLIALVLSVGMFAAGCKKDESPASSNNNTDIPPDPGGNAPATTINNVAPSATFAKTAGNENRIRINLLGILDPTTGSPISLVANQTLFVTEDQGINPHRHGYAAGRCGVCRRQLRQHGSGVGQHRCQDY